MGERDGAGGGGGWGHQESGSFWDTGSDLVTLPAGPCVRLREGVCVYVCIHFLYCGRYR